MGETGDGDTSAVLVLGAWLKSGDMGWATILGVELWLWLAGVEGSTSVRGSPEVESSTHTG